jgi:hypothetical protein
MTTDTAKTPLGTPSIDVAAMIQFKLDTSDLLADVYYIVKKNDLVMAKKIRDFQDKHALHFGTLS